MQPDSPRTLHGRQIGAGIFNHRLWIGAEGPCHHIIAIDEIDIYIGREIFVNAQG